MKVLWNNTLIVDLDISIHAETLTMTSIKFVQNLVKINEKMFRQTQNAFLIFTFSSILLDKY